MIITREKGMRMWGGGSGSTSASGVNGGGGFSLAVIEGEGTGNAYTDFTYESGILKLNKGSEFVTVDFFNKLFTAYDANGNVIAPNNTTPTLDNIKFKAGAWTEQYLSALGQNSSGGGGGGGIELSDVWQSLKTNTDDYANQKINSAHIPDLSGTYATKTWVNQQGFVTSSGVTSVAMTVPTGLAISGSPITTTGTLALTFANGYSIPTTAKQGNWDTAYGWGNHASAGYASASSVSTLQGYFTNGVANTAAKLNTGTTTYTAWGQTYWSSGVPQSISGNMTSVGSITPSANGNALGTTSARFNIYGTAGNFSGNVSITGTLGVTGATTLTGLLTANGGIVVPSGKTIKIGDCTISWDSTNSMLKFDTGIYSTGAVSALGSNSSGGGGGTFDEEAMWTALGTTSTAKVIASSHIPNLAASKITSGTFAAARIPVATASAVGGIKVGTTLAISDGVLNQKSGIATAGTYRSVTVDTYGRVTAGTNPTTLSGYGVLDDADGRYYALYGGTNLNPSSSNAVNLNNLLSVGSYYCASDAAAEYVSNKPITSNFAFRVWVSATIGTSGNYLRQRFQSRNQVAIFERVVGIGSGTVQPSDWGNWYLVQNDLNGYALASSLNNYLPLSGGTLTGSLTVHNSGVTALGYNAKFDVDTSREMGLAWLNTSGTRVASVTYHNTAQNIIINPIGSSSTWEDVVGKYSLFVGNNKLTYNTYPILHSNNYSSYALPLSGGTMSGPLKWVSASLPQTTTPNFLLTIDSFADGGTTKWALLSNVLVGKATADGDGNTISSTYLKLTGGTLTGDLLIKANLTCRCDMFQGTNPALGALDQGTSSFRGGLDNGEPAEYGCFIWTDWIYGTTKFQGGYSNGTKATLPLAFQPLGGNVGIGTSSPSSPLHVIGSQGWTIHSYSAASSSSFSSFYASNSGGQGIYCGTSSTASNIYVAAFYKGTTGDGSGGSPVMYMRADGKIGIGNSSPSEVLHVTGNILASGEVTASSDERKKDIIRNTQFNIRDIASARSIIYKWNDDRDNGCEKKIHGGSIAQDWLGKADSFLSQDGEGWYSINYGALALCSAITIAREVVKHEDRITLLEKENARLKARVEELEERRIA